MATSQNGWAVAFATPEGKTPDTIHYYPVPGTTTTVAVRKGEVAIVLNDLMAHLAKLEAPHTGWLWGWYVRPIRGQTDGYSNHSSGTAIDWNAPKHPRQSLSRTRGWSKANVTAIDLLLAGRYKGLVRWGARFKSRPYDPMHFELIGTKAQIAALAVSLMVKPKPPVAQKEKFDMVNIYRVTGSSERWAVCSNGTRWWIGPGEDKLEHFKLMMQKRWDMPDVTEYPATREDLDAGFYGVILPGSPVPTS